MKYLLILLLLVACTTTAKQKCDDAGGIYKVDPSCQHAPKAYKRCPGVCIVYIEPSK